MWTQANPCLWVRRRPTGAGRRCLSHHQAASCRLHHAGRTCPAACAACLPRRGLPRAGPEKPRQARQPRPKEPQDEIMRHTVLAKAPGLDAPHPPAPDAPEVKLPDLRTADGGLRGPAGCLLPLCRAGGLGGAGRGWARLGRAGLGGAGLGWLERRPASPAAASTGSSRMRIPTLLAAGCRLQTLRWALATTPPEPQRRPRRQLELAAVLPAESAPSVCLGCRVSFLTKSRLQPRC